MSFLARMRRIAGSLPPPYQAASHSSCPRSEPVAVGIGLEPSVGIHRGRRCRSVAGAAPMVRPHLSFELKVPGSLGWTVLGALVVCGRRRATRHPATFAFV